MVLLKHHSILPYPYEGNCREQAFTRFDRWSLSDKAIFVWRSFFCGMCGTRLANRAAPTPGGHAPWSSLLEKTLLPTAAHISKDAGQCAVVVKTGRGNGKARAE